MTGKSQKSAIIKMEAKNGNVKKTVFYHQKFRQEWKSDPQLCDWLREDGVNKNRAYCAYCKCNLLSKYCDLLTHAKTKKHLRAACLFEALQEGEESTDIKPAPSVAASSLSANTTKEHISDPDILRIGYQSKIHARKSQENGKYIPASHENKPKIEKRQSHFKKRKVSSGNKSDDDECMDEYNIFSDDEEEISQLITDNEVFINTSPGISQKLQAERIKAETEYFRQKALYFSKLVENSRVQRTLMIIQSRKLHLEVQKLQNEL